jgi:hypothetical protein
LWSLLMQVKIPADVGISPRYGDGAALTADDAMRQRQIGT